MSPLVRWEGGLILRACHGSKRMLGNVTEVRPSHDLWSEHGRHLSRHPMSLFILLSRLSSPFLPLHSWTPLLFMNLALHISGLREVLLPRTLDGKASRKLS